MFLLPCLTSIVNLSLSSVSVTTQLKKDIVAPFLKKPSMDPDQLSSFRPVSNLPFVAKVLEKVVSTRVNGSQERSQPA